MAAPRSRRASTASITPIARRGLDAPAADAPAGPSPARPGDPDAAVDARNITSRTTRRDRCAHAGAQIASGRMHSVTGPAASVGPRSPSGVQPPVPDLGRNKVHLAQERGGETGVFGLQIDPFAAGRRPRSAPCSSPRSGRRSPWLLPGHGSHGQRSRPPGAGSPSALPASARRSFRSSAPSGSSSSSTSGSTASARASATRCRCPPDSLRGPLAPAPAAPPAPASPRRAGSAFGPAHARASAARSPRCRAGSCAETARSPETPSSSAAPAARHADHVAPADQQRARGRVGKAADDVQKRGLAAARRAQQHDVFPRLDLSDTPASAWPSP